MTSESASKGKLAFLKDEQIISDLYHINERLGRGLQSDTPLPKQLSDRLIQSGGKRIRPLLLSIVYRSLEKAFPIKPRASKEDLYVLGAVSELVHTATLFHDDVLDQSAERRGMTASHLLYGNKNAILVGDFVYAEAFSQLMERALLEPSQKLATTIKQLVEGELRQHKMVEDRSLNMDTFIKVAECKTASLFAWCAQSGTWATGLDLKDQAYKFGQSLGLAFQLADDLLDSFSDDLHDPAKKQELLNEWKVSAPSFPVVMAHELGNKKVSELWTNLAQKDLSETEETKILEELFAEISNNKILKNCLDKTQKYLDDAKEASIHLGHSDEIQQCIEIINQRAQKAALKLKEI